MRGPSARSMLLVLVFQRACFHARSERVNWCWVCSPQSSNASVSGFTCSQNGFGAIIKPPKTALLLGTPADLTDLFLRPLFAFFDTLVAVAEGDPCAGDANPYR